MRRLLITVAATAICALAVASIASAGHGAKVASTKVTIAKGSGAFYGVVKSSNVSKCEDGRKLKLYKQKGKHPKPSKDKKVGTGKAVIGEGTDASWYIKPKSANGKHYARAGKISGCKAGTSPTI